jgi:hypothetical protein
MKRTTIYLPAEIEVRLKRETVRRGQPMAELVREAIEAYLADGADNGPPGAGAFSSGHADTAERAEDVLGELGFGRVAADAAYPKPTRRKIARRR